MVPMNTSTETADTIRSLDGACHALRNARDTSLPALERLQQAYAVLSSIYYALLHADRARRAKRSDATEATAAAKAAESLRADAQALIDDLTGVVR